MPAPDLIRTLTPVVEALEALEVPYYVGGSLASAAHGVARTSIDADVVADLRPHHVDAFVSRLEASYYVNPVRVREAVAARRSFNVIHLGTMLKVDVFVLRARDYDHAALARVVRQALEASDAAREFAVAAAEDVVLAKLEWFRKGGETSERQWHDVLGVLRISAEQLDRSYLHHWARRLGVHDLLDRALGDAGLAPA